MSDAATPNLPSRDFEKTSHFYATLSFSESWRDNGWMILKRGDLTLEFFPYPELDPFTCSFGCCLRLDNLGSFYATCKNAGLPEGCKGQPRLHPPKVASWGGRLGAWSTRMALSCDSFRISLPHERNVTLTKKGKAVRTLVGCTAEIKPAASLRAMNRRSQPSDRLRRRNEVHGPNENTF